MLPSVILRPARNAEMVRVVLAETSPGTREAEIRRECMVEIENRRFGWRRLALGVGLPRK